MMSNLAESVTTSHESSATEPGGAALPAIPKPKERRTPRSVASRAARGPLTLVRFAIRKLLWVVIRTIRALWRRPIITLLMVLAIYAGYRGYAEYVAADPPPSAVPHFEMVPPVPPADTVLQYLSAQKEFNAEGMWNSYSETTKAANLAQGSTLDTLRRAMDQLREQGLRYGDSQYVGGYQLTNGLAYYFYITTIKNDGGLQADVYQVFLTDPDGRILRVQSPQLE